MPSKGHPKVQVRLHPAALAQIQDRVEHERGVKGGAANWIRALVYRELGFPGSDEWEAVQGGEQAT